MNITKKNPVALAGASGLGILYSHEAEPITPNSRNQAVARICRQLGVSAPVARVYCDHSGLGGFQS